MSRLFALVLIVAVGATGVLPTVEGYRCIAMGQRMPAMDRDCCPTRDPAPRSIAAPCCESVPSTRLEVRESAPQPERVSPAPESGLLTFWAAVDGHFRSARAWDARTGGRPPGEQLRLLSALLRI